ncbi:MAG: NAD-glutamate dehydrogenase, partial [Actinomycetes bacterium]
MDSATRISEHLGEVAKNLSSLTTRLDAQEFTTAYLGQETLGEALGTPAPRAARMLAHHLELGYRRSPGEDLISITTPREASHGWSAGGSTLIQVVTDDRPFIVDTVTLILTEAGWTIRDLRHPILDVRREDGVLTRAGGHLIGDDDDESWLSVEAYPPPGTSAEDKVSELRERLLSGLRASRAVYADDAAIHERVAYVRRLLDETAQPVSPHQVRGITELLGWLADDHFEFFGYREYTVAGRDFTPVEGSGLGILRDPSPEEFHAYPLDEDAAVLVLTKDSRRAPLHRSGFMDYVAVRTFDRAGQVIGEHRFIGLLAASAYAESLSRIPLMSEKAEQVIERIGFDPETHSGQAVVQTLATFPRDELFQADVAELADVIATVVTIQDRRQARLFLRRGAYGRFWSCLVYLPRDRYRTVVRERIQTLLMARLAGASVEFQAAVTESVMARLLFVVKRADSTAEPEVSPDELEAEVVAATRSWSDDFNDAASELPAEARGVVFGESYEAAHSARQALADLLLANELAGPDDLRFALYRPDAVDDPADLRFKVITRQPMSLSRVIPHLDALGVEVIDERPFQWQLRGEPLSVYDFGFMLPAGLTLEDWALADRTRFSEAFAASYTGRCHPGKLNRLVMRAGLTWEQVTWLRCIARYLQQAGIPYSQPYVASALNANPVLAAAIVSAFESRFDPGQHTDEGQRDEDFDAEVAEILQALDAVESLDQDRILRMFVSVLRAIVRTNAFADDQPALAIKIDPLQLDLLPEPRPAHEIFVCSPRLQGVHLRFGAVARGGLRWSGRPEDFRTEVLGLVKAQMVKNTVIVPVGAKGGFVPLQLPDPRVDRTAWLAEGTACYEIFIGSLLSLTDNLVEGQVVPPPQVVRHDGDDSYLVVAADKGTATFSDIANRIALERGFWLGDAFASGGSVGYDHKGMGITARGAWESVKRHFYELGLDCQAEDFTCVGIGDMAGDVFGNGMLLSQHTRLVAAFNHAHIFLDPTPDAATSWAERKRLFDLPRSTWDDYDRALISSGGGVFPRSAKSIPLPEPVRKALKLSAGVKALAPNELIRAILTAPVDLLWNGGIGTYVKATEESHAQVGDKANDPLRVNGAELRARVVGEGGNLGLTQAGRIEFARAGGRINTDFIDNSAGVDTSDHEVNIKIALNRVVEAGELDAGGRAALLGEMTDEVAVAVLTDNHAQNAVLAVESTSARSLLDAHARFLRALERSGRLVRSVEFLPDDRQLAERRRDGQALTSPELSVLLAYAKLETGDAV